MGKNLKNVVMATIVTGYPPKPDQLWILFGLLYPENLVKIHAWVWAVKLPQALCPSHPDGTSWGLKRVNTVVLEKSV